MCYEIKKYPDGTSYVVSGYKSDNPFITFKINSYEDLWHLNQLIDSLNMQGKKPTITIPNLIDAQADRRFDGNQSSGLKLVCRFLNQMNANFLIFHPHNSEVVEALMDNVTIIDNESFIMRSIYCGGVGIAGDLYYTNEKIKKNLILMSADAGGFKPLMKLAEQINWKGETYSASKSRSFVKGKTQLTQIVDRQDFKGKDILIVDDLCVYGGTFVGLAKLLKERNCGKLYLAVSHMTMEKPNPELFKVYDKVFTTNSKYNNYYIPQKEGGVQPSNIEIVKLF